LRVARDLDLNLLPIAFALYDELSVSRAARLLGMSQPAVSMALRRMREAFDDPLFIRVPSGIAPTPRAHAIIQAARPLVARIYEDLLRGQEFDPATTTGSFTVALSDVGEMAFLPGVLTPLRAAAPRCTLRSVSVPPAQLAHELERGDIDAAIGYFPNLATKNFRQRRLSVHRFACLLRADHPIYAGRLRVADFLQVEHVVVAAPSRSQEVVERFFTRRGIKRKIALRVAHFLGVPLIVASSDLVATVPWAVARDFAEMSPRLAVALPPYDIPGFELKLHWHRRFDNEPRSRWFRDLLVRVFQEDRRSTMPPERSGAGLERRAR
jgi:DNA-binding transcriptional LysR family regulator